MYFNLISVLEINEQPKSQNEIYENEVDLEVAATGPGTLSYQWMKDGDVISDTILPDTTGTNTSTLQINCLSAEHDGKYVCVISYEDCMLQSETATLRGMYIQSFITPRVKLSTLTCFLKPSTFYIQNTFNLNA